VVVVSENVYALEASDAVDFGDVVDRDVTAPAIRQVLGVPPITVSTARHVITRTHTAAHCHADVFGDETTYNFTQAKAATSLRSAPA